jgi:peroxiredoxin
MTQIDPAAPAILAPRLRPGTRLPLFSLPSSRGGELGPGRYRQRKHLVLLLLDPEQPAGRAYLATMAELYGEFQEMDAEVLALVPYPAESDPAALSTRAATLSLPFPLLGDDGTARARLLPAAAPAGAAGAFVADRYGVLVFQSLGAGLAAVDPPAEVLAWTRFIGMQCSECLDFPDR